ncbi:uncharacterized protein LOC114280179 [Camellia sinensis]|uniref:uncharacterized protein LOC114280179 n=1 Tax=Camellia sinensis TaxID=4442 RepID=UPI001036E690|nr:uncharacterized protein LOC114280179 [Camellia sinensis]
MLKYGFKQSQADHTLFVKHSSHGKTTAFIVYIDDIVLIGDNVEEISCLKEYLAKEFEIKDLGYLKYFLGIEVARSKDVIFICQRKYVLDLLKETGMLAEVAIAVSTVSQFMHAPRTSHLEAVMRILRYLKSSPEKGLYFSKHSHLSVEAFTDADWAGLVTDRRSTSEYCTFVGGNLVT